MIDRLQSVVSELSGISADEITLDTNFRSDLGLNSLELVNLAVALEEEFDVEIPDREIAHIETVSDVVRLIEDMTD